LSVAAPPSPSCPSAARPAPGSSGLRSGRRQEDDQIHPDRQLGILGAGASGLSLALLTDADFVVIEGEGRPGGHAASTSIDGWVFDQGPHIMFSRDEVLLECMVASLGENVHRCRRNNKVAMAGTLAGYPLENDLAALPLPLRSDALISLLRTRETHREPRNLADWFTANFGEVLVSAYFRPYNEKVWNLPLESLSMSWAERIPRPPPEDVIRGALGEVSDGYLHQLFYSYPLRGGYSALMDAWASGVPAQDLVLGSPVARVVPAGDSVVVETSRGDWRVGQVVSTLPLKHLVEMVPGVPASVSAAVSRLIVNPIVITTLGFAGQDPNQFTSVYIPDEDYLVNRVSFPAVFSPHNAPSGCFSVQAEITCAPGSELLSWTDDAICDHVLGGLRRRSLVPPEHEPVFRLTERIDQGYVVYTNGYEDDVQLAAGWFASQGIIIHGRFGSHQYLNVDGCLRRSIELARKLGAKLTDADILDRFQGLATR
jgi:protoporphyrinogen oxidase